MDLKKNLGESNKGDSQQEQQVQQQALSVSMSMQQ